MCKFKSFIVTKDKILYSLKEEFHTHILDEYGINDTKQCADFVRVEFLPKNDIFDINLDNWKLKVDQDYIPDWFFVDAELPKLKKIMTEIIIPEQIFIDQKDLIIKNNTVYVRDCIVHVHNHTYVKAYGTSKIKAYDKCKICAYDNTEVEAYDESYIAAYDKYKICAYDESYIEAYDESRVYAKDKSIITIFDSAKIIRKEK